MTDDRTGAGVGSGEPVASAPSGDGITATGSHQNDRAPLPGTMGHDLSNQLVPAPAPKAQLITREQAGYIVPATVDEAMRLAKAIVQYGWAPDSYNNDPGKVMLGVMAAMEARLPPLFGVKNIAIIKGRPTMWGDALMALVQGYNLLANQEKIEIKRPEGADFEEAFDPDSTPVLNWPDWYGFEVKLWRRGQTMPYEGKFTVGDAKRAHLWIGTWTGKPRVPWENNPKRMLHIRARGFPLRDGFSDAFAGIAIREEVEDYLEPEDTTVDISSLDDEPTVEAPPMPGREDGAA